LRALPILPRPPPRRTCPAAAAHGRADAGLRGRRAELPRPAELRFRGDAIAQFQIGLGLEQPQLGVVRIALDGVQELDSGSAGLPVLQRRFAAGDHLGRRAAAIAARGGAEQESKEEGLFHG
jgi:hypothetical protein